MIGLLECDRGKVPSITVQVFSIYGMYLPFSTFRTRRSPDTHMRNKLKDFRNFFFKIFKVPLSRVFPPSLHDIKPRSAPREPDTDKSTNLLVMVSDTLPGYLCHIS